MRFKLPSTLAIVLLAGTLAASPPEKQLRTIRLLTPDAANDVTASVQLLEWEDGTASIARRVLVSRNMGERIVIDWQIDPAAGRFSARRIHEAAKRGSLEPQTDAQPPASGGTGYDLSWTADEWDFRGYHFSRTILRTGWTECPTSSSTYVTITPELSRYSGSAQALNPSNFTLSSWKVTNSYLSPLTADTRTLQVYPERQHFECGSMHGYYEYREVGPTDVPDDDEEVELSKHLYVSAAAWGSALMHSVTYWRGPDPTNDRDAITFTARPPGITCPSMGDGGGGGGGGGGGCYDPKMIECEQVQAHAASFCAPVISADGKPAGNCCGKTTADVIACAAEKLFE